MAVYQMQAVVPINKKPRLTLNLLGKRRPGGHKRGGSATPSQLEFTQAENHTSYSLQVPINKKPRLTLNLLGKRRPGGHKGGEGGSGTPWQLELKKSKIQIQVLFIPTPVCALMNPAGNSHLTVSSTCCKTRHVCLQVNYDQKNITTL